MGEERRNLAAKHLPLMKKLDVVVKQVLEKCKADSPAPCQAACPLHIDVRQYVKLVSERRFREAFHVVRATLPFPDIIGRTCTHPCEQECRRKDVDTPIQICALKRFVTEYPDNDLIAPPGGTKRQEIAIIGGGPAGLMAAHDLRLLGYRVTIFEREAFLGGMLLAAIPEYRLPRDVVLKELALIERLGITVRLSTRVGTDITFDQLQKQFSAVFLSPGQSVSRKLGLPGEELEDVHYGLHFLKRVKRGERVDIGKKVVVIGGGNVAIDAARSAWRLGGERVTVLYRRSRNEIPAASDEIEEAEQEGVDIRYLALPERIVGKAGKVTAIEYARTELGPLDDKGRKTPVRVAGATTLLEADTLIIATGQTADPPLLSDAFGSSTGSNGELKVDPLTLSTQVEGIFAGGDILGQEATVIAALAAGRKAALSIDRYLSGSMCASVPEDTECYRTPFVKSIEGIARQERGLPPKMAMSEREGSFDEVIHTFSETEAIREAGRCLDCRCGSCLTDCEFLTKYAIFPKQLAQTAKGGTAEGLEIAYSCSVCGLCKAVCPEGIDTGNLCLGIREYLVNHGKGPLPGHQAVEITQQFVDSDAFRLVHPDPRTGRCRSLFFPGCSLSGYSPSLVVKTYTYLLNRMGDVGILLGCCGGPRHLLGERAAFEQALSDLQGDMERLGAHELIVACPDCNKVISENRPGMRTRSVYEVIAELGLSGRPKGEGLTFSLHDSCTAHDQKTLRESVRLLMDKMGYSVQESPYSGETARCCGTGGLLPYADFDLAARVTKRRIDEFQFDIVTYCAACRDAFALEKPSLHVLDLVFNPEWTEARHQLPKSGKKKRQSQLETRLAIHEFIEKEKRTRD
jgi:NADPH-dependent glutamate synthase beta subunit-like oxidoreductase